ncbi:MAG: hypothetical protein K0U59_08455 [Gammaproteobacteria bacterium]|nr:hypothetical protein [Gammaproteobacteria bacterium]
MKPLSLFFILGILSSISSFASAVGGACEGASYQATPPANLDSFEMVGDTQVDWRRAQPGQWFIGVANTATDQLALVPVNVFESFRKLNSGTLNNRSERAMNRYASGAPGERDGVSIEPEWLLDRNPVYSHHVAAAIHHGFDIQSSIGFSVIKINDDFVLMKFSSTSLNGAHPDSKIYHSFSRQTFHNTDGFQPGSTSVSPAWQTALGDILSGKLNITHVIRSMD